MALNIVCCVKQVPDPETPASAFKVDEVAKKVVPAAGIAPVISQFDQIAVEAWRLMQYQLSGRSISTPHVRAGGQLIVRGSTAKPAETRVRIGTA